MKKLQPTDAPSEDIDEIVKLIEEHFSSDGKSNDVKVKGKFINRTISLRVFHSFLDNLL